MSQLPSTLGDFRILRRIGAGGMAEVFLAEKRGAEGTSKRVVVKRILPGQRRDARLYAMFVREAHLATGLDHPNVVHVFELQDHAEEGLLLVMEYVDGADLATVVKTTRRRSDRIPPYVAALIAREAAKGLHYAHQCTGADGAPLEIVHRDVSPQNILLSREGAVKIADLGVATARLYRDATVGVKGKLRYMAPEQAAGEPLDRRADVYALGVVLYEMLRLTSPYGARDELALLRAVREGRFEPPLARLTDVPADLLAILRRALAHDRADRYVTARDLAADLSHALVTQRRVIDEAAIEALVASTLAAPAEPAAQPFQAETVRTGPRWRDAVATPPRMLAAGAKVGRYLLEGHLGRGGMADVYAARDTTLDRQVALKILRGTTDQEARRRLLREAKLAARFEHPGSVVIYDVGEADGVGFIAMELVRGVPLSTFVGDPDVSLERRVRWLMCAARALAAAHAVGLVHRDVKPSNLMIRDGGEVKVLDFGIARAHEAGGERVGEPSTSQRSFVGTLRYAAPESFGGGSVDARADQFSWGITAWELLAGRHPFHDSDALDAVGSVLLEGIGPLAAAAPDVPAEVALAVDRALARRPEDRFASLDDAADALEPFAEVPARSTLRSISEGSAGALLAEAARATLTPPLAVPPPAPRRRALKVAALGILALAALVGVGVFRARLSPPAVTAAAVPVAPVVDAIACTDAVIEGEGDPVFAHALGMAACARLAPEIGVDWAMPDAKNHLEVRAHIQPDRCLITLRVAGVEATGTGAAPVAALWSAVSALTPRLASPPWPAERVRLWGARDEAGARRIFRVWRHGSINILPSVTAEVTQLLQTDGDSPIPHLLAIMNAVGGREVLNAEREAVLSRLDRVPPARADAIRGQLLAFPAEKDRRTAVRLLREAYAAGPGDHAMTALYGVLSARMGLPEAHAVIERLHQVAPTYSISPLTNAAYRTAYRDDERARKYIAWLGEMLPEVTGRSNPVQRLASLERFDEARAALDLARRLGLAGGDSDPFFNADARAQIDLAALSPASAREHAAPLLADPRFDGSMRGALAVIASYLQEGRIAEAAAAMTQNLERQRDQGNLAGALQLSMQALRLARWLDRPASPEHAATIERALAEHDDIPPLDRAEARAEIALFRRTPAVAEEALRALEEAAEQGADGDLLVRDRALVACLALTRAARGDRAAASLWERTDHAPYQARRVASLDAALALEALGDAAGAEAAYLIAADASNNLEDAAQRVLALARLPLLDRKQGREADAAEREAAIDRLWAHADAGLRDAVKRMR